MAARTEEESEALAMKAPTTSLKSISFWARWSPALASSCRITTFIVLTGDTIWLLLNTEATRMRQDHADEFMFVIITWIHIVLLAATFFYGIYFFIKGYRIARFQLKGIDSLVKNEQIRMIDGLVRHWHQPQEPATTQKSAPEQWITDWYIEGTKEAFAKYLAVECRTHLGSFSSRVMLEEAGVLAAIAFGSPLAAQLMYANSLEPLSLVALRVSLVLWAVLLVIQLVYLVFIFIKAQESGWKWKLRRVARHLRKTILRGDLESDCEEKGGKEIRLKTWIKEFLKEESDTPQEAKDRLENTIQPILDAVVV